MPITPEDLNALEAVLPGETAEHELLKPLIDKGFVVRTPKQEETFRNNYFESKFAEHNGTAYANVEKAVEELTGIKKLSPTEKASEYYTRAMGEYKTTTEGQRTELATLKAKEQAGFNNPDATKRITELEGLLAKKESDHTKELTKKEQEVFTARIEVQVESAVANLKDKLKIQYKGVEDDIIDAKLIKFHKTHTAKKLITGETVWEDAEGKTINDPKDFKALGTKDVVTNFFADLLEPKKEQGGAGSGGPGKKHVAGEAVPAPGPEVKTKSQLMDYLSEFGLIKGSKEYNEAYTKFREGLDLR